MEPLPRTPLHIARHHLAVADLIAIAVARLAVVLVLVFLVVAVALLHRRPFVVRPHGRRCCCCHQLLGRGAGAFLVRALDGRDGRFGGRGRAAGGAVWSGRLVFGRGGDGRGGGTGGRREGAGYGVGGLGGFARRGVEGGGSFMRFWGGVAGFGVFALEAVLEGFADITGDRFGFGPG